MSPHSIHSLSKTHAREKGVALILVMLIVLALMVIAGTFSYSMKIETKLANNTRSEGDLEWLGRSGVEFAKWVLVTQKRIPSEASFDATHQFWAGGPGPLDPIVENPFEGMSLKDNVCGPGRFSVEIVDQERRMNINSMRPRPLEMALAMVGAGSGDATAFYHALEDWKDGDDRERSGGGAESDHYLSLNPPYVAKNGPLDDITELLRIRGITPDMFWGPQAATWNPDLDPTLDLPPVGLVDLFVAVSSGRVNVNTASPQVLQVALNIDPQMVQEVIRRRSMEPYRSIGQLQTVIGGAVGAGGVPGAGMGTSGIQLDVTSTTFEVRVTAELGQARRRFVAIVRRMAQGPLAEPQVLYFRRE